MRRRDEGRCYHRQRDRSVATLGVTALDPQQPESTEPTSESAAAPEPEPALDPTSAAPSDPELESKPEPEPDLIPRPEGGPGPAAATPPPGPKATPPPGPDAPKAKAEPKAKAKAKKPKPPGLGEQFSKTAKAGAALVMAHVDLAKEEASEIGREGGRLAGLFSAALGLVIIAVILAIIGTSLFRGEWLLGSLGWGVLHGVLLFVTGAVALVLLALRVDPMRIVRALVIGVVVAVSSSLVLGLGLLNQAYASIGDALALPFDPAYRPLIVGMGLGAIVGLVVAIVLAARAKAPNWFFAIAGAIVFGSLVGAFTSITFTAQVGAGIGITFGYLTWAGLMGLDVYRTGIDVEGLKARFIPTMTIDTSKETLEWLKERTPHGNGS